MAQYYLDKNGKLTTQKPSSSAINKTTKTKEKTGFVKKSGAFADGYQFGDITETIRATSNDAKISILQGLGNMGEGITDLALFGVAGASKFLGADSFADDVKKLAQKNSVDKAADWVRKNTAFNLKGNKIDVDDYSVIGDTGDSINQALGQIGGIILTGGLGASAGLSAAGVTALTTGTTFASSAGRGVGEAFESGATDSQAATYGALSGAIDAGTELLFGGLGKTVKALGLSKGLTSIDDVFAKKLSSKISNRFFKTITEWGVKSSAEGLEEVLAGIGSAAAKNLTYMKDEDLGKLVKDENLLEQFAVGAIAAGLAQGGDVFTSVKKDVDYISGLSTDEEAVINKEVEKRIADEEKGGNELTKKRKNQIYDEALRDLERGELSTDTIEETLGGDAYTKYKNAMAQLDEFKANRKSIKDEFDTLNKMKTGDRTGEQTDRLEELRGKISELDSQLASSNLESTVKNLRGELDAVVSKVFKGDRNLLLSATYREKEKRGEAFEADLSQYKDKKQREIVKKAAESGILNNTRRTHEFVDMISKISADKGVSFDFTNNERLKESGFAKDGRVINGYVTKEGITLNLNSAKALNSVVGHEITHVLEGTELYGEMQKALFEYAKSKKDYAGRRKTLEELYKDVKDADVDAELTADLVGDYLFTDSDFINDLSVKNRNVFQKIYDEIKYLCKVVTAGSKEARELERVKKLFEKVYKDSKNAEKSSNSTKFSLSESKVPTRAELERKPAMNVVDISTPQTKGSFSARRKQILNSVDEIISKPYLNKDTNTMIFLTKNSYTHAFNNLGEIQLNAAEHLPELIENAVLTHAEQATHGSDYTNGVYTFFAAAKTDRVLPVKLKVKEYTYSGQDLPKNIKEYFENSPRGYASSYDTVVLEVEEIEKAPSGSVKDVNQQDSFLDPEELSTVSIADLLKLVKGKAENYIPKAALSSDFNSQSRKQAQFEIIEETNPAPNSYMTWIRSADDVKTLAETLEDSDWDGVEEFDPDLTRNDIENAIKSGKITVYSSYPIKNGVFVSPSRMEAMSYSGDSKVYSKTVNIDDVAWIDPTQGQFAAVGEKFSLSKENTSSPIAPLPGYNVRGEEISLDLGPVREDIAKNATTTTATENIAPDFAPISEDEANALQSKNIASLDDADAPPMEQNIPYNDLPGDTTALPKTVVASIAKEVRNASYGLKNQDVHKVRELIEEYATSEAPSREALVDRLSDILTTSYTQQTDDLLPEVKAYLKNTKIKVSQDIRNDFGDDYASEQRHYFGKIGFSKNGIAVDSIYQELSDLYPSYFPSDVINPADQLRVMMDVADMQVYEEFAYEPDDAELEEVADVIVNGINGYRTATAQRAAEAMARQTENAIKRGDIAPPREFDAPIKDTKQGDAKAEEPKAPPKIAEVLTEEPEAPKKKERSAFMMARTALLDKFSVFEDLALKKHNRELMGKANHMLSSESRAQHMIGKGIKSKGIKSLNDIRAQVENSGLTKDFYNYLHHLHNADRMSLEANAKATIEGLQGKFANLKTEQIYAIAAKEITDKTTPRTAETIRQARDYVAALDAKNKPVFGDDVTADISRQTAAELEKAHPEFKAWAQDVYDYNNYLRELMVNKGVISQETADLWAKIYPHYVPIRRAGHDGAAINVALDTNKTGVDAPIKRATGGNSDILPMFDTMALRTEQTYRAIAKNAFGVELMNTLGTRIENSKASLDEVIDSVDNHEELLKKGDKGQAPTFTVFENGERVTFEITEDMYDALKPTSDGLKYKNKVLGGASSIMRGLLTEYNPVFTLTNAVKDAQDVLINSQHAVKTYMNFPKAVKEILTNGKIFTEYIENGGEQNTYFDSEAKMFTKDDSGMDDSGIKKAIGITFNAISKANNFVERIPRLAEYIASREAGRSIEVSMLDAARVTTNFQAGGDVTKFLNRNGATFLNASVQGFNQQVRNVREAKANGLKGVLTLAAKFAAVGLSASILNHLLWDDDEEYEELSDYVKDNYYVVAKNSDGTFVRIPKGRTMAVIQDAFEQMENLITGNDEVDLMNFGELLISNLAPNNPIDNNVFAPIIQAHTNKTWYGEDLVPTRLQDLPNAEQYDESTDAFSKWLGEATADLGALSLSPYRVNYLLNQYSGGLGDVFLPMMTPEAERGDNSLLGNMIAPLKDKFTTNAVTNNQNTGDFYDTMDELTKNAKSSKATDEDILKYKYFSSINSQLGKLYGQKREIQNSKLSNKEKYAAALEIQEQINELTRGSLGAYNDVYIDGPYATVGDVQFRWYEPGEDSTSEAGWQKISDKQLEKQEEVTSSLGISASRYWGNKEEYDFAYEYPARYAVAKSVGGYEAYKVYSSELYDIKADKDSSGKSISGSRKKKVIEYIKNLDADYETKIILYKSEYTSDDRYNYEIINYLNSREDISYKEMVEMLKLLGFEVDSRGNISW